MINLTHNIILSFLNNNNLIAIKNQILEINDKSVDYGLVLSPKDVEEVIKSRKDSLKTYGRIDLNMDITKKIMEILYTSQYTDKDDYLEFSENGKLLKCRVAGFSATRNNLDIRPIYSVTDCADWIYATSENMLESGWKIQKGQNFVSVNTL